MNSRPRYPAPGDFHRSRRGRRCLAVSTQFRGRRRLSRLALPFRVPTTAAVAAPGPSRLLPEAACVPALQRWRSGIQRRRTAARLSPWEPNLFWVRTNLVFSGEEAPDILPGWSIEVIGRAGIGAGLQRWVLCAAGNLADSLAIIPRLYWPI